MTTSIMPYKQRDGWKAGVQCILGPLAAAQGNRIYLLHNQLSVHLHKNSITALKHLRIEVEYNHVTLLSYN